jgi:polysaccharide deacetylase family protein (PEP-CTERM system associated)
MNEFVNALTIDVEDYFQVSGFESDISRSEWTHFECRVEQNTDRLLDLFARHEVKATFFVLGWIADRYPQVVRRIYDGGHEIGSHSYWHRLVYQQSPDEFRDDLRRSRDVLEAIIGRPVTMYRAPSFSITKRSLWALPILVEEGIEVDSSVYPVVHDRYGIPGFPTVPHQVDTRSGPIWEVPPAVSKFASIHLPVGGGGYFRLLPVSVTSYFLKRFNRREARGFTFYLHPWEVDAAQPRLSQGKAISRFRHYVNLAKTESKLDSLIAKFRFGPLGELVSQADRQCGSTGDYRFQTA